MKTRAQFAMKSGTGRFLFLSGFALVWVTAVLPAVDEREASAGVEVEDAWLRPALVGMNTALYLTLSNESPDPQWIVDAEVGVAESVEFHETTIESAHGSHGQHMQTVRMGRVEAYEVPAGGTLSLKPGGFHIMLLGLTRDLLDGERLVVVLRTEEGHAIRVDARVTHAEVGVTDAE